MWLKHFAELVPGCSTFARHKHLVAGAMIILLIMTIPVPTLFSGNLPARTGTFDSQVADRIMEAVLASSPMIPR